MKNCISTPKKSTRCRELFTFLEVIYARFGFRATYNIIKSRSLMPKENKRTPFLIFVSGALVFKPGMLVTGHGHVRCVRPTLNITPLWGFFVATRFNVNKGLMNIAQKAMLRAECLRVLPKRDNELQLMVARKK